MPAAQITRIMVNNPWHSTFKLELLKLVLLEGVLGLLLLLRLGGSRGLLGLLWGLLHHFRF